MTIRVLRAGLLTTVQDKGRFGYRQHGVAACGAMDAFALRAANLLVGNDDGEAALEITVIGPSLRFEADALISVCGGDLSPEADGIPVPMWRPVYVKAGVSLTFGACRSGARAYLAVGGGIDVPQVMNSRSTYLKAGIGGFKGRALKEGDTLPVGARSSLGEPPDERGAEPLYATEWFAGREALPAYAANPVVRAVRGRDFGLFGEESRERFFSEPFRVTPESDRMGFRLAGPELKRKQGSELLSEAVAFGAVQVPPDGSPIVLMADCQTVGGYPRIAHVITADLPVLAQVKPGGIVRFAEVSLQEAESLHLRREADLALLAGAIALYIRERGRWRPCSRSI